MSLIKSSSAFIASHSVSVPAGEKKSVNAVGRVFYCSAAVGPFKMNFNDGEFFDVIGSGVGWELKAEDRYARLQFSSVVANEIVFYTGDFAYHQNVVVPVSKVAPTITRGSQFTLAPSAQILLPGSGAAYGFGYRKHLIIQNNSPGAVNLCQVTDRDNHILNAILTAETKAFETSDDLILVNPNTSDSSGHLMEIFYFP